MLIAGRHPGPTLFLFSDVCLRVPSGLLPTRCLLGIFFGVDLKD